jgi:DNA-binding transcriptional ArsR family regulator
MEKARIIVGSKGKFKEILITESVKEIVEKMLNTKNRRKVIDKKEKLFKRITCLEIDYPEVIVYYNYFRNFKSRNDYYVSMKQAAIHYLSHIRKSDSRVTLEIIGEVVDLTHSSVSKHLKVTEKQRHPDYNEIVVVMDKMIKQNLYPLVKKVLNTNFTTKTIYEWRELLKN